MNPELEKLETLIEERHLEGIRIAKVDGTEATVVAHEHSVKHYPTILFVLDGTYHVYSGVRTAESLIEFALRLRSGNAYF